MRLDADGLRVVAVTDAVYPFNHGGKEVRQYELWRRLARSGVRVDVHTMAWWGDDETWEQDGVTYHALCPLRPLYSGERRSIRQAAAFAWAVRRLPCAAADVVEVDALPYLHLPVVWFVARRRRVPLVATWHEFWGPAYWRRYLGPAGTLAALIERAAGSLGDVVVAASALTAQRLRELRDATTVAIIENGVDLATVAEARSGAARSTATGDSGEHLIAVGRLLEHKNVDAAIAALPLLTNPHVRLRVVGVGPEERNLRSLAGELGVGDRVDFLGRLEDHASVLALIRDSRLLVFPSTREGFGMVAAEAIAVGTPVITSDGADNAARTLVEDGVTGAVCAAEPRAIAEAIERVWDLKETVAARPIPPRWNWDALAEQLHDVLRTAAQAGRRPVGSRR